MTHPHDLALLYDLLDARIAPAAAEELRKRIGEEPELAAAWDELKRMRDGLRALPTPPVPSAFLEGVKARAGIVDKAPAKPSPAGKGAPASAAPGAAGTGRVLRMRPWTAAIAAGIGIVAGLVGYLVASRDESAPVHVESAKDQTKKDEGSFRRTRADEATPDLGGVTAHAEKNELTDATDARTDAKPASPHALPPSAEPPRFGQPGGAIAPGLRQPADAQPRPTAAPAPAPVVPPPPAPENRLRRADSDETAAGAADDGFAYVREGVDDVLVVHAASVDEARAQVSVFYAAISQGEGTGDAWKAATVPHLSRWTGAPVVRLAKESAPLAAARAEGASAEADAPEPPTATRPVPPPAPGRTAGAPPAAGERRGAGTPPSGPQTGGAGAGAVPPESQVVLGSFLLELSPAEWARANARVVAADGFIGYVGPAGKANGPAPLGGAKAPETGLAEADKATEPAARAKKTSSEPGKPATPPSAPPAPPTTPADPRATAGEDGAADAKAPRRRVRILVLPPAGTTTR